MGILEVVLSEEKERGKRKERRGRSKASVPPLLGARLIPRGALEPEGHHRVAPWGKGPTFGIPPGCGLQRGRQVHNLPDKAPPFGQEQFSGGESARSIQQLAEDTQRRGCEWATTSIDSSCLPKATFWLAARSRLKCVSQPCHWLIRSTFYNGNTYHYTTFYKAFSDLWSHIMTTIILGDRQGQTFVCPWHEG